MAMPPAVRGAGSASFNYWQFGIMIEIILQWIELVQLTVDLLLSSNRTRSRRVVFGVL
jgi:hypothetical protein